MDINKYYKIRILLNGNDLNFTVKALAIENGFLKFIDKYGKTQEYNLINIVSSEEISKKQFEGIKK